MKIEEEIPSAGEIDSQALNLGKMKLAELIEALQGVMNDIPDEYKADATVQILSSDFYVSYRREETEEEKREKLERLRRERAEYSKDFEERHK